MGDWIHVNMFREVRSRALFFIHIQKSKAGKIKGLREVKFAHQGWIYSNRIAVKTTIKYFFTFKITHSKKVIYLKYIYFILSVVQIY